MSAACERLTKNRSQQKQCAIEPPTLTTNPPGSPAESIADYAQRYLACARAGFDDRKAIAVVTSFDLGEPKTQADVRRLGSSGSSTLRYLAASRLRERGLGALRQARPVEEGSPLKQLTDSIGARGTIWTLGFASVVGYSTLNEDLSVRRAQTLRSMLIAADGLDPARINYRGLGANLISGTEQPQQNHSEQTAVAFACSEAPLAQ